VKLSSVQHRTFGIERLNRDHARYLLYLLSLVPALMLLVATERYGLRLTRDSIHYVTVAEFLWAGQGIQSFNDNYVKWPPLYPLVLAIGSMGQIDPVEAGRYVNAIIGAAIVIIGIAWLLRHVQSYTLLGMGALALVVSFPLMRANVFLMTEGLFVLITMLSLFQLATFLHSQSRSTLIWAAVFAALACLTRYIGVTVVMTAGLLLLFGYRASWREKILNGLLFGIIAVAPFAAWLLRNYIVSGTFAGPRGPSSQSLTENISLVFQVLTGWFVPSEVERLPLLLTDVAVAGLWLLALGLFGFLLWSTRDRWREGWPIVPLVVFGVVYTAFLIYSASTVYYAPLDTRFLTPLWMPLILSVFFLADKARPQILTLAPPVRYGLLLLSGACLLLEPLDQTLFLLQRVHRVDINRYSYEIWGDTAFVNYLQENPPIGGDVFANEAEAVYRQTGVATRSMHPAAMQARPGDYVIWMGPQGPNVRGGDMLTHFLETYESDVVAHFPEQGTIYRIEEAQP
jgi:hypothetical protein